MRHSNASERFKALVAARLLMGQFDSWEVFEQERAAARQVVNRRAARSVSTQIGRSARDLSTETQAFISENFVDCDYARLANLCDKIPSGSGLYLRLDEFERQFFLLTDRIRSCVPTYAHVSISTWGLKFEFPEHHFLRDLETALPELLEVKSRLVAFRTSGSNPREEPGQVADLIARENFLSRSITSAAFSLVEAFLSGLFFTAVQEGTIGLLTCDEQFLNYAKTRESAPMKERLDQIVRFASGGTRSGSDEPFKSFIEIGKKYRDAIHHTTPFGRKDVDPGGRLIALYEIDGNIALQCTLLASDTITAVSGCAYGDASKTDIARRCSELVHKVRGLVDETTRKERV